MDFLINEWILNRWKQKVVALFMAMILWLFVNHSITATKTVAGVTVRIVNLSPEKAVEGLLPNGVLNKRLTLSLTGTKEVIDHIEPGDLEVVLDASSAPDEWIVEITKKNLVSLNPDIDISRDLTQITHPEFIIDLDKMMTAKIPISILKPTGKAPPGYEYLGVLPHKLMQTVSGPKTAIQQLHTKGLEITFDLSEISKEDLDSIQTAKSGYYSDEVSYKIPDIWKKISIPFLNRPLQPLNDPNAEKLTIDFLRKEYIPIQRKLPIRVFYPLQTIEETNPKKTPLKETSLIQEIYDVKVLNTPLLAYGISRLFIDMIRDHLEIVITAEPDENGKLPWNLEFVDQELLEKKFISFLFQRHQLANDQSEMLVEQRESHWKSRFREYMKNLKLYLAPNQPLVLENTLEEDGLLVEQK